MKLNSEGFSAVEALLILVIVSIIGAVGWKVWDARQRTDQPNPEQTTTQSENAPINNPQAAGYLELEGLGLKLSLVDITKDAYAYKSTQGYTYISVRHFDSVEGFEDCRAGMINGQEAFGIVAISSGKIGDDYIGSRIDQELLDSVDAFQKDGVYYWIEPGNGPCMDINTIRQDDPEMVRFSQVRDALTDATLSAL